MPLLWICISFLAGAVVPLFRAVSWQAAAIAAFGFVILAIIEVRFLRGHFFYIQLRKNLPVPVMVLAAGFSLGMLRAELGKPSFTPDDLGFYHGKPSVTLLGVVSQPVEKHDRSTMLTVSAHEVFFSGSSPTAVKGNVMLLLPAGSDFSYGDRLEIVGHLDAPPERDDFSYKQYLENQGVYSYMAYPRIRLLEKDAGNPILAAIYHVRDAIATSVTRVVPQPQAAFLSGILVGRDEAMPDSQKVAFKLTGTSHLVAISGFNITILSVLFLGLTRRLFSYGWAVIIAIILVAGYSVMAGGNPAVVRAAIMGALAMVAKSIGRTKTAVSGLALTASIMVLFQPLILRDIGFQLSVLATAGILVIGGPINDRFLSRVTRQDNPAEINAGWSSLGEFVLITLAAQVATLPVLLYNFHSFPLVGLIVNPIVLPVQAAAMVLGGIAAVGGLVFAPLGELLGLVAWVPLAFTTRVVELFASLGNSSSLNVNMDLGQAVVFGAILVTLVVFWKQLTARLNHFFFPAVFLLLTGVLAVLLNSILLYPDGKLHIEVYRQGNNLSAFILSPGGQRILLTNLPGDKDLSGFVEKRIPIMNGGLDALIIPNPTASSGTGLADTLLHLQPGKVYINSLSGGYRVQNKLTAALKASDTTGQEMTADVQYDLGGGAILTISGVDQSGSIIDLQWGTERIILQYGEPQTYNHRANVSSIPVKAVVYDHPPENVFIQSGFQVLTSTLPKDLEQNGYVVQEDGWLELRTDGKLTTVLEGANSFFTK